MNCQWDRIWDHKDRDLCFGVAVDSSDNIYLTGYSYDEGGGSNISLVKYNNLGEYQWHRVWGGTGIYSDDRAYDIFFIIE